MKHDPIRSGTRKPLNVSIDTGVVAAAREYGLNLSQISENALRKAAQVELERRWREDNRDAIEGWNRWYKKNGHPLEAYRLF